MESKHQCDRHKKPCCKGPTGPTGPQGGSCNTCPTGPTGPQGIQGQQGRQGIQGPQGNGGPQGPKGDQGQKGDSGPKGDQGQKGDSGPKGDQGQKGDSGPKGDQGQKGDQGSKGDPGPRGEQGPAGERGKRGPKGDCCSCALLQISAFGNGDCSFKNQYQVCPNPAAIIDFDQSVIVTDKSAINSPSPGVIQVFNCKAKLYKISVSNSFSGQYLDGIDHGKIQLNFRLVVNDNVSLPAKLGEIFSITIKPGNDYTISFDRIIKLCDCDTVKLYVSCSPCPTSPISQTTAILPFYYNPKSYNVTTKQAIGP